MTNYLGAKYWKPGKLQDLVYLQRGFDITKDKQKEGGVPVYSSSGLTSWHNESMASGPGVIIGRKGTLGSVHYSEGDYWPHDTTLWSKSLNNNNARFVFYALKCLDLERFNVGGANPTLNRNHIHGLPIFVPDRGVQDEIVSVLSTYDDLIENNQRRIALLEDTMRVLYREWFVHLRFPGHEHVKVRRGLPEGWDHKPIIDLADILRGKSYGSHELVESGGQPFVNLKCIARYGGFRLSGVKGFQGEYKPQHLVAQGDIVIAVTDMTRDAMIVAQAARIPKAIGDDAIFSMDLVKVAPKPGIYADWLYGLLRFSRFSVEVREKATGATVLHLRPKHIESWQATVPTTFLCHLYSEHVCCLTAQMGTLEMQNQKLSQARDLLLPRLMNGKIEL
jgi:type I restriction enzyme S subunit